MRIGENRVKFMAREACGGSVKILALQNVRKQFLYPTNKSETTSPPLIYYITDDGLAGFPNIFFTLN